MTAALAVPTGVLLGQIRAGRRIPQRAIAEKTGVYGRTAVWLWDSGRKSPRISSAIAYAAALDHRFIVRRGGHIICDLVDALTNLGGLRQSAGLTQREAAERLHVAPRTVGDLERDAGPDSYLDTVERFLVSCGYQVDLVAAELAVAA